MRIRNRDVKVGDVFKAKATGPFGRNAGTRYWMVISITKRRPFSEVHHMLGLDKDWNIVSTTSYGAHVMAEREFIYNIKNVGQFVLTLQSEKPE